jgi:hypothetical protein
MNILRTGVWSSVEASLHLVVHQAADTVELLVIFDVTAHFQPDVMMPLNCSC